MAEPPGRAVILTRLGTELGQEVRRTVDFQAGIWSAVWLCGRQFSLPVMVNLALSTWM